MPPSDRRRVGYVLKMYPRFSETFILTEILAHEAAGLDLTIFSLKHPGDGRFHEALARVRAPVIYLGTESLRATDFWADLVRAGSPNPGVWSRLSAAAGDDVYDVHQAALLSAHVRARGITHLHAHFATSAATVAMHAASMAGVTFSFTAHAKDIYLDSVNHDRMRRLLREASAGVTVSDFNLQHFRATYGPEARRVRRVYNGLDLDEFPFEAPAGRSRSIIGVGRLVEKKGFHSLVEASAILRERGRSFRCEIIGDGPLAGPLAEAVRRRQLEECVVLCGPLPTSQVVQRMRAAAALAAPCVVGADGNRDGLPTVLLEAMALGTPCVSTDVTGIPEVVRHMETGLRVPQHDAVALADALDRLLDDAALRCRLAEPARRLIVDQFDAHRNCRRLRELFAGEPDAVGAGGRA